MMTREKRGTTAGSTREIPANLLPCHPQYFLFLTNKILGYSREKTEVGVGGQQLAVLQVLWFEGEGILLGFSDHLKLQCERIIGVSETLVTSSWLPVSMIFCSLGSSSIL